MIKVVLATLIFCAFSINTFAQETMKNSSNRDILINAENYHANIDRFSSAIFTGKIATTPIAHQAIMDTIMSDRSLDILLSRPLTDAEIAVLAKSSANRIRERFQALLNEIN